MPKLHLVNSHLGGMGQSLLTRVMIHIHYSLQIPCLAFDADSPTCDVYCFYPDVTERIHFSSDDYTVTDRIIDAVEMGQSAIVNLPSNSSQFLYDWLTGDRVAQCLRTFAQKDPLRQYGIVNWFLSNGTELSLQEFMASVETYGADMDHVLVKNLGKSKQELWNQMKSYPGLSQVLSFPYVHQLEFPQFFQPIGFDTLLMTFAQVISMPPGDPLRLNGLDCYRVGQFLEQAQLNIFQLGLLQDAHQGDR